MQSYAQNGEDVRLARAFAGQSTGFYIDIGANDPAFHTITRHFYEQGWHGINVDASPHYAAMCEKHRPRDVNLCAAVSDAVHDLTFWEYPVSHGGLSTLSSTEADAHLRRGLHPVPRVVVSTTLAAICEAHVPPGTEIDFLTVDVEGHEGRVLRGGDWTKCRPRVVLLESVRPLTTTSCHETWEPFLIDAGYMYACFDGLNRYYVRGDQRLLAPSSRGDCAGRRVGLFCPPW